MIEHHLYDMYYAKYCSKDVPIAKSVYVKTKEKVCSEGVKRKD
jgi:hypothetical protein